MRLCLPLVLLVAVTVGRAAGAPSPTQSTGTLAAAGTVYFYFNGYELPPGMIGGLPSIAVLRDERVVAKAKQRTYFGVRVAPGRHTFASRSLRSSPRETAIELAITAGQQVFIRLDVVIDFSWRMKVTTHLRVVDAEEGRLMLAALRPLDVMSIEDTARVTTEAPAPAPPATGGPETRSWSAPLPEEPGIYLMLEQALHRVPAEITTVRTTSVHGLTANLKNARSATRITVPAEFIVRCTDDTTVADYVLLQLFTRRDRREFRTLDGGKSAMRQGPDRMAVPFEAQRIGPDVYRVLIVAVPRGEYGFVPPGAAPSGSVAARAVTYTFGVD